jgi:hypothetical protein
MKTAEEVADDIVRKYSGQYSLIAAHMEIAQALTAFAGERVAEFEKVALENVAEVRNAALEEAARVCDEEIHLDGDQCETGKKIRALKL